MRREILVTFDCLSHIAVAFSLRDVSPNRIAVEDAHAFWNAAARVHAGGAETFFAHASEFRRRTACDRRKKFGGVGGAGAFSRRGGAAASNPSQLSL